MAGNSFLVTAVQGPVVDPDPARPLGKGEALAVMRHIDADAPIRMLDMWKRPAAVLRRVIAIVVDAVNGVFAAWARSHVSKEVFKRSPALADRNAARLVVAEVLAVRVRGAIKDAGPNTVLGGFAHAVRALGSAVSLCKLLFADAATGRREAAFKVLRPRGFLAAAVASAYPHGAALRIVEGRAMQCGEKAEALASQVKWFGHKHSLVRRAIGAAHLNGAI